MVEELQIVEKLEDFENIIKSNKFVIANFFALWCTPSKYISPFFIEQSTINKDVKFIKINIDKAEEICNKFPIQSIPTFLMFKDGVLFDTFSGGIKKQLIKNIDKLLGRESSNLDGEIKDLNEFEKIVKDNKFVLVEFFDEMNVACQTIFPVFQELKKKYPDIKFINCDFIEAKEIVSKYCTNSLPYFISFKNGKKEGRYSGSKPKKLIGFIEELISPDISSITLNIHPHPLFEKNKSYFICDLCYNKFEKKSKCFKCKECKYIICEKCKVDTEENKPIEVSKDTLKSKYHEIHPLIKTKRSCICDVCGKSIKKSFCCKQCDFDLCFDCYGK